MDRIDPEFGFAGTALALAMIVWLSLVMPFRSRCGYRRLLAIGNSDPAALERSYRRGIAQLWLTVGVAVVIVAISPGVSLDDIGVALPSGWHLWLTLALTAYTVAGMFLGLVKARRRLRRGDPSPAREAVAFMLPRTPAERRLALWLAISAGVAEEIVYRGLLIAAFVGILGWTPKLAAFAALAAFSFAHLYQGKHGIWRTSLIGLLITLLYALSGSLAPAIIVHVVVDVIALLLLPVVPTPPPATVPPTPDEPTRTPVKPASTTPLSPTPGAVPDSIS